MTGNTNTGSLSSTITDAGTLTAGATTLTNARITGIAPISSLTNSNLVLTDASNNLTTLAVLDVAHGGTGTSTLGNFVDLTSAQTITGNKTFTGNTVVGTLSSTTVDVSGNLAVNGNTSLRNTGVNGDLSVTGNTNTGSLSSTTTDAGTLTAGSTKLGATSITADLGVTGTVAANTLTATATNAGTLAAGNTNITGTLNAGTTTLASANVNTN